MKKKRKSPKFLSLRRKNEVTEIFHDNQPEVHRLEPEVGLNRKEKDPNKRNSMLTQIENDPGKLFIFIIYFIF